MRPESAIVLGTDSTSKIFQIQKHFAPRRSGDEQLDLGLLIVCVCVCVSLNHGCPWLPVNTSHVKLSASG